MNKEVHFKKYITAYDKLIVLLFVATIKDKSGLQLAVLLAAARRWLDLWCEDARLSELAKETATVALMYTIATLPKRNRKASEAPSIIDRLACNLPWPGTTSPESSQGDGAADDQPTKPARNLLLWSALAGAALTILLQLLGD